MARRYHQGKYTVKNREKYLGDPTNCIYRSGWEKKLMIALDHSEKVVKWGSEETVIPYLSPLDGAVHRYFMDFTVVAKGADGKPVVTLIEVKPEAQKHAPKMKKGRRKSLYEKELQTYLVNQAKWKAAENLCAKKGWRFVVCTEKELFGKL